MLHQDVFVVILFTTPFILSTNGQSDYTVYTNASTWVGASQTCYLATPSINISTDGNYSVDIQNSNIQLTKGVNYWLGYHKSHRVFQYEGCAALPAGLTYNYILQPIPGHCFTACSLIAKTKYYGMRKIIQNTIEMVECYCLAEKPKNLLETQCTRNCIYNSLYPFVLCGGTDHLSVYSSKDMKSLAMKVKNHPNAGFVGHCITYENINKDAHEWFWTGCSRSLHPLCEQTTTDGTRLLAEYKTKYENWMKAAQYCLNQGLYPATIVFDDRLQYDRASMEVLSPSWTAMFRDQAVYISWKGNPLPGDQCAYITVDDNDKARMSFSPCLEANKMNYICQAGPTTDPTSTDNSHSSHPSGSTTEESPTNAKLQQGEISLLVPIVIGVVCGIIVIVAIVAIILCVRRRNRQKHNDSETKSIPDLEHYTKNLSAMDYAMVDRLTHGEEDVDGYVNGHFNGSTGLAGNDHAPPPAPGDVVMDFRQSPDSPRILMSPKYYDSLTRSLKRRDPDNTYNKLNSKDYDDMYNNGNHAGKRNMQQSDGLYNKLESQNSADTYDRTANAPKGKEEFANPDYDRARADDNTYNATGGKDPGAVYSRVNKAERRID